MISPPMTPEEQLYMMQIHEETLRKMHSEPSQKDREVSKQFTVSNWQVQSSSDL